MNLKTKIAIIGLWHQGIVASGCMSQFGFEVIGADTSVDKVNKLSTGESPIFEPGLEELISKGIDSGNLHFTNDLESAVNNVEFVFLMFDTPVNSNDEVDISNILSAVELIAPKLSDGCTIWNTSQVPVGTSEILSSKINEINPSLNFSIVYSPENLRLGNAIHLFNNPALPILGSNDKTAIIKMEKLLAPLKVKWMHVNLRTAEMCKHALNSFLATSISFANEMGNICDELGVDSSKVADALRMEPRIGNKAPLLSGMGFSGGTLARDVQTLRSLGKKLGIETFLLDGLWSANQYQNNFVVRSLKSLFGNLEGKKISILGITYKPGTSTLRRSVAIETINSLNDLGAEIKAHDPKADGRELQNYSGFEFCKDISQTLHQTDAIAVMTGWEIYKDIKWNDMKEIVSNPLLIDCNNMYDSSVLKDLGYSYYGIGRGHKAGGS